MARVLRAMITLFSDEHHCPTAGENEQRLLFFLQEIGYY
jgi:hypothetical protein